MAIDLAEIRDSLAKSHIIWKKHAFEKAIERGIRRTSIQEIVYNGEIIEDYPRDTPYPGLLILGWHQNQPLHVVIAYDELTNYCFIITVYQPDSDHFENDYKMRKRR
ncbi:MAG: hypothetical protein BRD50_01360 [Bacteroidetes bacterium SW_11_45_7]|nr:MAG: hypothetical protein BRD50_01360 [Bacteroidetes bacterium SW_11_45_7]